MNKGRILAIVLVWSVLLGIIALSYRFIVAPFFAAKEEQSIEQQKEEALKATSSDSRYTYQIQLGLDSFSGYAILRSNDFAEELANRKIKLILNDDSANYPQRLNDLKNNKIQFAAFTIDAFIKTCSEAKIDLNEIPSIVSIIDETRGADAIVAYKSTFPNIDAMNQANVKFVTVGNAPSETLAKIVTTNFGLNKLSKDFLSLQSSPKDVYEIYRKSNLEDKNVYVLWQPYVSKMLENPNVHVLIDSSKFRGYIVDVLVVNRDFLFKNPQLVEDVVKSYFIAKYNNAKTMTKLVLEDAKKTGEPLTDKQAEELVGGIWWKNTQENYAHFGFSQNKLQHIEDMILNITKILGKYGVTDPTNGQPNLLYYNKIIQNLSTTNFHPGFDAEDVKDEKLAELSIEEWNSLKPAGTLSVPEIVFARGTSVLREPGKNTLDVLVETLNSFPNYYVMVKGNASKNGNVEANKQLAQSRAEVVRNYLLEKGIHEHRIRAIAGDLGDSISVSFVLGGTSY